MNSATIARTETLINSDPTLERAARNTDDIVKTENGGLCPRNDEVSIHLVLTKPVHIVLADFTRKSRLTEEHGSHTTSTVDGLPTSSQINADEQVSLENRATMPSTLITILEDWIV